MAEPIEAQVRLDRIVVLIASNMVAEVCSLYVARADGMLELFATEGLNRTAVHQTTMKPDEGLVGLIARTAEPLAISDAQNHPSFSYKPETGEEIYQSFLGVPVLRGGATLGVLVVQNRARRTYSEEEVEALQTTAMLLAEMIASGGFQAISGQPAAAIATRRPLAVKGAPIAEGLGLGHAVLHQPRVVVSKIVGIGAIGDGDQCDARVGRRNDRRRRRRRPRRAPRRAGSVSHDRARSRLAASVARGRDQRPHR
jgi:phosphotransferase system enzyme I (PtsP)